MGPTWSLTNQGTREMERHILNGLIYEVLGQSYAFNPFICGPQVSRLYIKNKILTLNPMIQSI